MDLVPKKVGIILYIAPNQLAIDGFKSGLEKLGYTEGKNITYELRKADAQVDKSDAIAREFVNKDFDLVYTVSSVPGRSMLKATKEAGKTDLPVVFAYADNPDKTGLIQSFKSSGNNTTGVATSFSEITAKKIEFLRQISPKAKKLGIFWGVHTDPAGTLVLNEIRARASGLGFTLVEYKVENPPGPASTEEMQKRANEIKIGSIDALFRLPGSTVSTTENVNIVLELGKRLKIPVVGLSQPDVERGALFTYAEDLLATGKQAAIFADKILKGAKPSDIPVERARKNSMIINSKTAKDIGITVPDSILAITDVKIEK